MSSTTTNLGLVKMASGETIGQWSDANNGSGQNLDKIDTAIGTLNSQIGAIGEIVTGNGNSQNVTIPNATPTSCNQLTLSKGVWMIIGCADWSSGSDGYRQIAFNSDALNPGRNACTTTIPIAGKETYQQVSMLKSVSSNENITLYATQTNGGNLIVYPFLYAIRIGLG